MRSSLKIVYTTWTVANRSGAELFVTELASAVSRHGHQVCVLTPFPGATAETLRAKGIAVVTDPRLVPFKPDVVHAQHQPTLLAALRAYPGIPAIFTVHDAISRFDEPLDFPQIVRQVAVDERCRARIEKKREIAHTKIQTILNAVDLSRFKARSQLPSIPKRALVFSNYASARTHLNPIVEACRRCGLEVDVVGAAAGTQASSPEDVLPRYDIVFAKARCALEAMSSGTATILCDYAGLGSIVTSDKVAEFRRLNFGGGLLTREPTADAIVNEIRKYDPDDAKCVSDFIRADADLEKATARWINLYRQAAAVGPIDCTYKDTQKLARFGRRWTPVYALKQVSVMLDRTPPLGPAINGFARPIWFKIVSPRQ